MTTENLIVRRLNTPAWIGLSLSTIDRLRREGHFVPAVRLGEKAVGFLKADLDAWLTTRKEVA